jgi:hypothetical protein
MTYLFFRRNATGGLMFYPVEGIEREEQVIDHVVLNPGIVKVTDETGKRIVWQEGQVTSMEKKQ